MNFLDFDEQVNTEHSVGESSLNPFYERSTTPDDDISIENHDTPEPTQLTESKSYQYSDNDMTNEENIQDSPSDETDINTNISDLTMDHDRNITNQAEMAEKNMNEVITLEKISAFFDQVIGVCIV